MQEGAGHRSVWTSVWPVVVTLAVALVDSGPLSMSPLGWLTTFIVSTAICHFAVPFLGAKFPLNLMRAKAGEPLAIVFLRIILASALFGLLVGWVSMALPLLHAHAGK